MQMWSPILLQAFEFAPRTVGTQWSFGDAGHSPCARVLEQEQLSWPKDQQHPAGRHGQRRKDVSREGKSANDAESSREPPQLAQEGQEWGEVGNGLQKKRQMGGHKDAVVGWVGPPAGRNVIEEEYRGFKPQWGDRVSQVIQTVKNLPASEGDVRDAGSIPGLGRSPGGGHGNPLQ